MKSKRKNGAARISRDPRIMMGKPCIKGTRLTVELILDRLAYHPREDLLESYPDLTPEDIQAALLYAAKEVGGRTVLETIENKR